MIIDSILDALLDTLKMIAFLYVAFLIMEYIEHHAQEKMAKKLKNGPIYGSLLGAVPQCGFSCMASSLYSSKLISLGTLLAVYISTSDEAVLLLFAEGLSKSNVLSIVGLLLGKVALGILVGYIIDLIINKKVEPDFSCCKHCHCEKNIFLAALLHTLKIAAFVFIITSLLNIAIASIGKEQLSNFLLKGSFFQPFLISLVALIPNCVSSVLITELYITGSITFFGCFGGLVASAGVGYLILFRSNKNMKENLMIVGIMYAISLAIGFLGLI